MSGRGAPNFVLVGCEFRNLTFRPEIRRGPDFNRFAGGSSFSN